MHVLDWCLTSLSLAGPNGLAVPSNRRAIDRRESPMTRLSRLRRMFSWHWIRWFLAISTAPFVWWACTSHPLTQPNPQPEQETDVYISVSPVRKLDLVFMIDNSPSMAPKQAK